MSPPAAAEIDFIGGQGLRDRSFKTQLPEHVPPSAPKQQTVKQKRPPYSIAWYNYFPINYLVFYYKLFFTWKFYVHRVVGLMYLTHYGLSLGMYFYDYDRYRTSTLPWSLHLFALIQAITAALTFTFLKNYSTGDQGFFSDKFTISYNFVLEHSFFTGIGLFQCLYLTPVGYKVFSTEIPLIEAVMVFLPYFVRRLWPKTSFRGSLNNPQTKTEKNLQFMDVATNLAKLFYVWAKHFIGFFPNYLRFLNRITPQQLYHIHLLLILGAFATTPSVFLHTLKFKKMIGPRTAFVIYYVAYIIIFLSFLRNYELYTRNLDIVVLTAIGMTLNFAKFKVQMAWQVLVAGLLFAARYNVLPEAISYVLPLAVGP